VRLSYVIKGFTYIFTYLLNYLRTLSGSTCFDHQLTRPLHANLLLQQQTEGIHTTKNKKAVLSQRWPHDARYV